MIANASLEHRGRYGAAIRRAVQIPIRASALVAGVMSFVAALIFLAAVLIYPQITVISALFAANGLLAFRISLSRLGVERVPRRTLLTLAAASGALWNVSDGPSQSQLTLGLFFVVAVAALCVDLAYRTPRVPLD